MAVGSGPAAVAVSGAGVTSGEAVRDKLDSGEGFLSGAAWGIQALKRRGTKAVTHMHLAMYPLNVRVN